MGRKKTPKLIWDYRELPEIVTSGEAAAYLRVDRHTVVNLAGSGKLPGFKVGGQYRFFRDELRAYLEQLQRAGPGRAANG